MAQAKGKKETKALKERLFSKPELVWDKLSSKEKDQVFDLGERYKQFLSKAKTEREAVDEIIATAEAAGFRDINKAGRSRKLYAVNGAKAAALAVLGSEPLHMGLRIVAAHLDCPRLDLKQNPLYEDLDMAYLKTHYYGGIKKYQWVARPLAVHGKVVLADGRELDLKIGEAADEPVFIVNDLLPHLAQNVQATKKMADIVVGEKLNVLIGALPYPDTDVSDRFKLAVLVYLNNTYGITEDDLVSAELEVVPAGPAKDVGMDRSMVGSYGQDDRASAFMALSALCEVLNPTYTCLALFVDKEEVGSEGPTAAKSRFFQMVVMDLFAKAGEPVLVSHLEKALFRSKAISADVNAAMDPDWAEVHEKRNAARLGYGISLSKFGGIRGKVGSNDASAEYVGWLRRVFKNAGIVWHTGELGKVDEGGGGTIAKFLAEHGMDVVDMGVPVLSMHSPFEITHKGDIYMGCRAFKAFFST
ncbi:MAG: aminopeptidase [Deltaproteobacteria bacterium]|nr:aminopeptidase [Deltaproteobacteria bacterium]